MNQLEGLFELNTSASDICLKDGLIERISKAKALANIATSEDFLENFQDLRKTYGNCRIFKFLDQVIAQ